jgi:hypothetical protein
MNKMKTTIAIAAALVAGASTQSFAAATAPVSSKVGTITFSLTAVGQTNISTSNTQLDAGDWTDSPFHYRTLTTKLTQKEIIKYISMVLYGKPTGFTANAKLILVQGELSGFFNITPDLQSATPPLATGSNYLSSGPWTTLDPDVSTVLANAANSTYLDLPNGRHFQTEPSADGTSTSYPPGHFQPWGQIFVQDGTKEVNVTPFFQFKVHECYDCFYLNSFVSDATFQYQTSGGSSGKINGPPCCYTPPVPPNHVIIGHGVDRYYLNIGFDNTINNPYLDPNDAAQYLGITGISTFGTTGGGVSFDGITPDALRYTNTIASHIISAPSPWEARFTLNGVLTYNWQLKILNKTDSYPDFLGGANYTATGYGFIALVCQVINGSAAISEMNTANGFANTPWYNDWYGYNDQGDAQVLEVPYNVPASLTEHYSVLTYSTDLSNEITPD